MHLVSEIAKHDKRVSPLHHALLKSHVENGCRPSTPNTSGYVEYFRLAISNVNLVLVKNT